MFASENRFAEHDRFRATICAVSIMAFARSDMRRQYESDAAALRRRGDLTAI
jgi:hypothetical protein